MAENFKLLPDELVSFIKKQKIFFVATALKDGHINLSPKGMDTLRIVDKNRVMWLNLTGSGNETAAHLKYDPRITLMFCAFEGKPMILRIYGQAKVYHADTPGWNDHISLFPSIAGSRQIIDIDIEFAKTSCGYSIPFMEYQKERDGLVKWAKKKGEKELEIWQKEHNTTSLDGLATGWPAGGS